LNANLNLSKVGLEIEFNLLRLDVKSPNEFLHIFINMMQELSWWLSLITLLI